MKRYIGVILSTAIVLNIGSLTSFAQADTYTIFVDSTALMAYDQHGEAIIDKEKVDFSSDVSGALTIDFLQTGQSIYIPLDLETVNQAYDFSALTDACLQLPDGTTVPKCIKNDDLGNPELYSVSLKKHEGAKLIDNVEIVARLSSEAASRFFIKMTVSDTNSKDTKFAGDLVIKAKKTAYGTGDTLGAYFAGTVIEEQDEIILPIRFWVNRETEDGLICRLVYNPDYGKNNTVVWGESAALHFEPDDDVSQFYARLMTKNNMSIVDTYGDPQDAHLWFYTFLENPSLTTQHAATLTLGIPWDQDDDTIPDLANCHIYELGDGDILTEVWNVQYDTDNIETTGMAGWSFQTRRLGTYVLSSKALDLDNAVSDAPIVGGGRSENRAVFIKAFGISMALFAAIAGIAIYHKAKKCR